MSLYSNESIIHTGNVLQDFGNKAAQAVQGVVGTQSNASDGQISAADLVRGISSSSTATAASDDSAISSFSAASASTAATSVSSSSAVKESSSVVKESSSVVQESSSSSSSGYQAFSSSQFRSSSKLLLLEHTCTHSELRGTVLHVDCRRLDGSIGHSHIDLDEIIGFVNGHFEWNLKGFSRYCLGFELDARNFTLIIRYRLHEGGDIQVAYIDLRLRLRNSDGVIVLVEHNKNLSVMLSEVPWMKFKVVAEPDLNIFANHPVMQQTLTHLAEHAVEHVTTEMHKKLTIAMSVAISEVTKTAMSYITSQMQTLVADAAGYASASPSISAAHSLGLYRGAQYVDRGGYIQGGDLQVSGYQGSGGAYIQGSGIQVSGYQRNGVQIGGGGVGVLANGAAQVIANGTGYAAAALNASSSSSYSNTKQSEESRSEVVTSESRSQSDVEVAKQSLASQIASAIA